MLRPHVAGLTRRIDRRPTAYAAGADLSGVDPNFCSRWRLCENSALRS